MTKTQGCHCIGHCIWWLKDYKSGSESNLKRLIVLFHVALLVAYDWTLEIHFLTAKWKIALDFFAYC